MSGKGNEFVAKFAGGHMERISFRGENVRIHGEGKRSKAIKWSMVWLGLGLSVFSKCSCV